LQYYKIKKNILFSFTIIFLSLYAQPILAQEIEQEPEPPRLPEPSPPPEPIMPPKSETIPPPFSGETESEKIQRLLLRKIIN
jgi:hypothetical protein